jgi:hypothetical protein
MGFHSHMLGLANLRKIMGRIPAIKKKSKWRRVGDENKRRDVSSLLFPQTNEDNVNLSKVFVNLSATRDW